MLSTFRKTRMLLPAAATALGIGILGGGVTPAPEARAASHSDAPLIKLDPQANLTDVYSFIGMRNGVKVLNVIVHVRPFSEPGDGVIYDKFSDDALYTIHVANPSTGASLRRYDFRFSGPSANLKNPNTILSYGRGTGLGAITDIDGPSRNYVQTYSVTRTIGGGSPVVLGSNLLTPPPNVGKNTTPNYNDASGFAVSGATTAAGLDNYTRNAIFPASPSATQETFFSGPREDGFFADTPGIFDFLDDRVVLPSPGAGSPGGTFGMSPPGTSTAGGPQTTGAIVGVDGFKGYNVLAFAIQIPVSELGGETSGYTDPFFGAKSGVGVYASVSRPRITLRSTTGAPTSSGPFIQVNRMGNPLFNEVLVALQDKDRYNRTQPTGDAAFATYAENPELAVLINARFGAAVTATFGGLIPETGRTDLRAVFIPDVLRVNINSDPVRLAGQAGFSRLGFIGGDTVADGGTGASGGWPNGRRFGDDVVDIALTALASGPTYATINQVGDNIQVNDQVYHQVFPYSATPHAGRDNRKDRE